MHPPVRGGTHYLIIPRDRPYLPGGPGPLGPGLSPLFTIATQLASDLAQTKADATNWLKGAEYATLRSRPR
jgi:hypothetical protein